MAGKAAAVCQESVVYGSAAAPEEADGRAASLPADS